MISYIIIYNNTICINKLEINIYYINPVLYDNAIVYNDIIKMVIIDTLTHCIYMYR